MKRHNKKRNSALLYEFIIRHISYCLVNDNKEEANKALALSKKYFSKGTALHEEMKLIDAIVRANVSSKGSAQKIIDEVVSFGAGLNSRKIDMEKSLLIKEINHTFDGGFYDYKVPNYPVYASAQTLLTESRNKKKTLNSLDKIKLEDKILEHLVRDVETPVNEFKINPKYNDAVYKFVIQRFNQKYEKTLSESQKKLLTKYVVYMLSENKAVIESAVDKEVENIKKQIKSIEDEDLKTNDELMGKIDKCYKELAVTDFTNITEENILNLLRYIQLAEEISSDA